MKLQSLALYGCRGIDRSDHLAKLQDDLPNLKCLRVDNAAEHDGMILSGDSDDDSDSTLWSGEVAIPCAHVGMPMEEDEYSDFD